MEPMHKRVAGLDVHRMKHVVTVLIEEKDGTLTKVTRQFGGFKRDLRELIGWLGEHRVERVVMESTGIYWKSVYASLSAAGIPALVVNARHVKNVPGRKTDVADSEWLAQLARFGLMRGSFIPPKDLRELRLVSRYRRKLSGMLAGEKNRLHKLLDDAGIKLGGVVADIDGVSARRMVEGLIAGKSPGELATLGLGPLKDKREALEASMEGELSPRHRLILEAAYRHIRYLEDELAALDRYLIEAMQPYAWAGQLLQTLPGIDKISAAMILIEISDDLTRFGTADRPRGQDSALATTRARVSARAVKRLMATPSCATCCAKWLTPPDERKASFAPNTTALSSVAGIKKPSSLLRISCCEPSSSCSPPANPIGILGLITRRPAWRKTLPAGSEH
jgi:transposase